MTILIHFERSETCANHHGLPDGRVVTHSFDTSEGSWVQLTYNALRTQDGGELAVMDDVGDWYYDDQPYSDIVIEFLGV